MTSSVKKRGGVPVKAGAVGICRRGGEAKPAPMTFLLPLMLLLLLSARLASATTVTQVRIVQSACANTLASGSNTIAFPYPVTAGDMLVVAAGSGTSTGSTIGTPTDSQGTYTVVGAAGGGGPPTDYKSYAGIYYRMASSSGPDTVTINFNSFIRNAWCIYELYGASSATPSFGTGAFTSSARAQIFPAVTFGAGSFLIGAVGSYQSGSTVTPTPGFTVDMNNHNYYVIEHQIVSPPPTQLYEFNYEYAPAQQSAQIQIGTLLLSYGNLDAIIIAASIATIVVLLFRKRLMPRKRARRKRRR